MTTPAPEVYEFDAAAVQGALEAAEQVQVAGADPTALDLTAAQAAEVTILAECITVTVRNGRVCLRLPLDLGQVCLPIPTNVVDGTSARACVWVRTKWKVPTGACASVSVGGDEIARMCYP